jgi:hypothetical protein
MQWILNFKNIRICQELNKLRNAIFLQVKKYSVRIHYEM